MIQKKNAKYDNCKIYSLDDKFLGFCDQKKYDWYVKKELVTVIDDKTIKLNFEPKLNGKDGKFEEYCKVEMKTQCVVCGNKKNLNKFHVIPSEFRKFFPIHMKSHASHDVVLVCTPCHNELNCIYGEYREFLLLKYNIEVNQESCKIKTCAKNQLKLINKSDKTKKNNIKMVNNETILNEYLGHPYSIEELEELKNLCIYDGIGSAKSIGEYIVSKNKNYLEQFEETWRNIFIEQIEPKFLPECW